MLTLLVVLALGAGATIGVVAWLRSQHPAVLAERCTATADGTPWSLDPEQADNAALIAAISVRRGLPAHAAVVALATALQESSLRNLDHGDRDSLGLFQQRPSQGWGTAAQIMDPVYSTGTFYDRLVKVPNWQDISVAAAAQAVQRSAFPDAYAGHEPGARAFAAALTGTTAATLSCALHPAERAGSKDALTVRLSRDLAALPVSAADTTGRVVVDATGLPAASGAGGAQSAGWAVGQWAVAVADDQAIVAVQVDDRIWTRDTSAWKQAPSRLAAGTVSITLATPS